MKVMKTWCAPIVLAGLALSALPAGAQLTRIEPVLAFPEAGMDDPAAYQGYQTRFFRDAKGNVVQIYLDARSGRVVSLLADAVNESVGFTVRDGAGQPVRLSWGSLGARNGIASSVRRKPAVVSQSGTRPGAWKGASRTIEYDLVANTPGIDIGWILLGSMRVERDLQYSGRHLQPFSAPTFRLPDLEALAANVERLEPAERDRELRLLHAGSVSELRERLQPTLIASDGNVSVRFTQPAFDAQTHLELELRVNPREAAVEIPADHPGTVSIRARSGNATRFMVRVTTDAPSLTPLTRGEIFNADFLRFLAQERAASDRARRGGALAARNPSRAGPVSHYRQIERDVRGVELLSAKEKLMAGLPNYATYFGRDMMMTALMMQPIWSDAMSEHVIASVLRKLGPNGDVSHEEALGGQAIRENSAAYNARLDEYFDARAKGDVSRADAALAQARSLLGNLQTVRENYHMLDDEFQLPVLAARYLANPSVSSARKRAFLMDSSDGRGPRLALLLRELGLVSSLAEPYARNPTVLNLVGSPRLDSTHWRSVSWRDSNAGYANGRFAMDINAIWVPRALASISEILASLKSLGFTSEQLAAMAPESRGAPLGAFAAGPELLQRAIATWNGAVRHFVVRLDAELIQNRVQAKLRSLPSSERSYWEGVLASTGADRQPLEFLAISLDAEGHPIPVVNTDPATWLFLHDRGDSASVAPRERALSDVRSFMRAYPVGLFVDKLGPLVTNDAYASTDIWEAFRTGTYHSPRVVWGREVNLIMLGLAKQIASSVDAAGRPRDPSLAPYVTELREALRRTTAAVEASGLKHTELWSYEISGGALKPIRYGVSTDIQLWNVTDLAVQFALSRLPRQ